MTVRNPSCGRSSLGVVAAVRVALRGSSPLAIVSALAVATTLSPAADAQAQASGSAQAQNTPASGTLEEVVVTGIRQSMETAQAIKQNAEQVVESVTAQDIGALPDRSVSEALQRIPGITLQRTNENRDPARLASEGGGVFIRGLSWVRSELNGRDIFSANNGRGLSFEDVSADLLAGIDVYKNPSAEMVEGGIGGIVNLRTRLPFDSKDQLLAFSADYNYADLKEDGFFSGNALYSDQWDTGIGRVGALLAYSLGNIGNRTDSIQTGRFEPRTLGAGQDGHAAGSTVYIPNSIGWRSIDWEQKRTSVSAAFQWEPTDTVLVTLQGMRAKADPRDIERALGDTDGGYATDDPSYTFDSRGVITSGTIRNFKPTADTRYQQSHKETSDYALNVRFIPNERWAFSADVQYVESHADLLSMTAFTQLAPPLGTLDFDLRGDTPRLNLNQPAQTDQSQYWWAAAMDHLEDNDAKSWAERADAEFTFDDNPWLKSFRFGVRATDKEATTRQTGWNWGLLSQQFWGSGGGAAVHLDEDGFADQVNNAGTPDDPSDDFVMAPASHNSGLPGASQLFSFGNFFRGDVNLPGVAWFPAASLVNAGNANAFELLRSTQSSGWGWAPLTAESFSSARPGADNVTGGINDQTERTEAAYGVLRFAHDSPIGPMDGNIGVRVVRTKADANGLSGTVAGPTSGDSAACAAAAATANADPGIPDLDCTAYNAALAFAAGVTGDTLPAIDAANSYTDVLPTFNLRFHLTDDLQLRFAVGKAIVRPTFAQMVPFTTLSFSFDNSFYPNAAGFAKAAGGNPKLKPTRATQFDTSLEWYFAPSGSLTGALFYKDVKDYIFLGNEEETYTSGDETLTFLTTRNMNGDSGRIQGLEVGYQQFYDFLPGILNGLGIVANFTYVDSSGGKNTAINVIEPAQVAGAADQDLPLEGLSKTSYNFAVVYEKYDISARLAYNWRERFLLTTSAANIQRPVWSEDYGQLDGSVFYSITDNVKVGLQATNILNTRTFLDVGGVTLAPRYGWTDTDRRVAIAMRTSF